jgi:hypothetical protein
MMIEMNVAEEFAFMNRAVEVNILLKRFSYNRFKHYKGIDRLSGPNGQT